MGLCVLLQGAHQARLDCREEVDRCGLVQPGALAGQQPGIEIQPDHPALCHPQLAGTDVNRTGGLPAFEALWRVHGVGALGTRLGTGAAIARPATEVPRGAGLQAFFSASRA